MRVTLHSFGVILLMHDILNCFGVTLLKHITLNCFGVKGHHCDLSEFYTELVG